MCGIIAYISNRVVYENTLMSNSIKGILQRGYDSVGIMRKYNSTIKFSKAITNIVEHFTRLDIQEHNLMIAHTRWATHGKVSIHNTHPHVDNKSLFSIVHNGIITNHNDLIKEYDLDDLRSETDTEVIVQIMSIEYQKLNDIELALDVVISKLKGDWAIVIVPLFIDEPMLFVHCNNMPLIISRNERLIAIASEYTGLPFSKGKYARLKTNKTYIITSEMSLEAYTYFTNSISHNEQHYTIKEINEQPKLIENLALPNRPDVSDYEYCIQLYKRKYFPEFFPYNDFVAIISHISFDS